MNIFIAYGGATGKLLAAEMRDWLPKVLPGVKPFYAPWDTGKGAPWRDVIEKQLEASDAALLCLTADTLRRPWILFEAGAISQKATVYPLLFGFSPDLVSDGPLEQYHVTEFTEADLPRLLEALNTSSGQPARDKAALDRVFRKSWPELRKKVDGILNRQARCFADEIQGGWWERISSNDRDNVLCFLQIESGEGRLRLHGTAYNSEGTPTGQWNSEVAVVDSERAMLIHNWEGSRLIEPFGTRRGIAQVSFEKDASGQINVGHGSFDDSDMKSVYMTKAVQFVRASKQETTVMTSKAAGPKRSMVKRKVKEI